MYKADPNHEEQLHREIYNLLSSNVVGFFAETELPQLYHDHHVLKEAYEKLRIENVAIKHGLRQREAELHEMRRRNEQLEKVVKVFACSVASLPSCVILVDCR